MNRLLQTVLSILLFTFVVSVSAPQVHAQWFETDSKDCFWESINLDALCLGTHTAAVVNGFYTNLVLQIIGPVPGITQPTAIDPNHPKLLALREKSIMNQSAKVIAALYENPPARTSYALQDLGETFGLLPKKIYAQGPGIGFAGLSPLLPIWKVFRNISYILLAIVMVAIGFMIMFRQKIDPKTVITVQSAIPGIIVTLFLITFSYAIAAIMIDLMYVSLILILSMLHGSMPGVTLDVTVQDYLGGNWLKIGGSMWKGGMANLMDILHYFTGWGPAAATFGITAGIGSLLGVAFGSWTVGLVIGGITILAVVLIAIVLLFAVIRVLFMLLTAYIQILIAVIIGPVQLLAGAIPGNNAFAGWIKNLFSNLMVFPVTAVLIMIAALLSGYTDAQAQGAPLWSPPIVGVTGYGTSALISLGILLSIPTIVGGIKEALKAKSPVAVGGMGQIGGFIGTASQYAVQYAMTKSQIDAMKGLAPPPNKDTHSPSPVDTKAR